MTDDERKDEAAAEPIEDLEAPAEAWAGIEGGNCASPTCVGGHSKVIVFCEQPTCRDTGSVCTGPSSGVVVHLM
jgi:hypothetical protein